MPRSKPGVVWKSSSGEIGGEREHTQQRLCGTNEAACKQNNFALKSQLQRLRAR